MNTDKKRTIGFQILWGLVLLGGILLRTICLTKYPMGMNADEAYAGYEAWALLQEGVDSHGYRFPVYFISWGNGMNVLYSYLLIPWMKLLGWSALTIRLPQAVMGCLTLPVFYLLLKEIKDKTFALFGMFLLAITPWHIMMCRWGLESNLVPFFLLLGVYFIVKAWKYSGKYYIPAFLMFGLVLYAYAIMWAFVPIFLALGLAWGSYCKKIKWNRYPVMGVILLVTLAVPLLLFVAVNQGWIPEIRTDFLSIPMMESMRSGEISLQNMGSKFKDLLYFLVTQVDRDIFNTSNVGIYYFCSAPFILIGLIDSMAASARDLKHREGREHSIMLLWFLAAVLTGCVISYVNTNKINCIHLPMIYFAVDGCMLCIRKFSKKLIYPVLAMYGCFLLLFADWYFDEEKIYFYYGYEDALDYAKNITDGDIGTVMLRYPIILGYDEMKPSEYLDELDDIKNYGEAEQFGRYRIEPSPEDMEEDIVYVVQKNYEQSYLQPGFATVFDNGYYVVIAAQ